MKNDGLDNDLIERIRDDPYFGPVKAELDSLLDPKTFVGRAPEQVVEFLEEEVKPVLDKYTPEQLQGKAVFKM